MSNKTEISVGDLVAINTPYGIYVVDVATIEGTELYGRYKSVNDIDHIPQKWDAGGCHGMFDKYELVDILYHGPIVIKDNLLWCEDSVIDVRVADYITRCNGYMHAEQYIKDNK